MWLLAVGSSPTRLFFAGLFEVLLLRQQPAARVPDCMPAWRWFHKGNLSKSSNAHPRVWEARDKQTRLTYLLSYGDALAHASNTEGRTNQTVRGHLTLNSTLRTLSILLAQAHPTTPDYIFLESGQWHLHHVQEVQIQNGHAWMRAVLQSNGGQWWRGCAWLGGLEYSSDGWKEMRHIRHSSIPSVNQEMRHTASASGCSFINASAFCPSTYSPGRNLTDPDVQAANRAGCDSAEATDSSVVAHCCMDERCTLEIAQGNCSSTRESHSGYGPTRPCLSRMVCVESHFFGAALLRIVLHALGQAQISVPSVASGHCRLAASLAPASTAVLPPSSWRGGRNLCAVRVGCAHGSTQVPGGGGDWDEAQSSERGIHVAGYRE